jgi:hypothetical protein
MQLGACQIDTTSKAHPLELKNKYGQEVFFKINGGKHVPL